MQRAAKSAVKAMHLEGPARKVYGPAMRIYRGVHRLGREISGLDKTITQRYLKRESIRKLHLGCGGNVLDGWLNTDLSPVSNRIIYLDATKRFPFRDDTFDYAFTEHLIEHISYSQGQRMLAECFRVLRVGGKIRISTPDLLFLMSLYQADKSELQNNYIEWNINRLLTEKNEKDYVKGPRRFEDTFVINNFVRDWGHTFIYDEKVLRFAMEQVGFKDITKCDLNQSDDPILRDLENENRMPEGFLRLETFTLEGKKS